MAKLYFKFGAMGSSKSAQALMTKFNYEEKNKTPVGKISGIGNGVISVRDYAGASYAG